MLTKQCNIRVNCCRSRYFVWLLLLLLLPIWGCAPSLQDVSSRGTEQINTATPLTSSCGEDRSGDIANLETLASLQDEEEFEQSFAGELEPLSTEEIPLPGPNEFGSLESEAANTDNIEELAEVSEPNVSYDFPIIINEQVEFFLDMFQNSKRETFGRWLARSGRYLPMIQEELADAGLPLDLCYLPMIESGFRLTAYSRARAVGPWQFMLGTGKLYGLNVNDHVDERRDPIKSTKAAIRFLSDLYDEFQSWPLAVAAYNAGGGRVRSAIRKTGSTDFWDLAKSEHLKKETKYYVPQLMAAIIIAKNPVAYGFEGIEYEEPLSFENIEVPKWTSLQAVALAADTPLEEIYDLNRHLRRAITPADKKYCRLRVPVGKKDRITRDLPRVAATVSTDYKTHVVKKGETVTRICNKYSIDKKTLLKANNLRTANLLAGQRLRIPYRTTSYKLLDKSLAAARIGPADKAPENLVKHKILPGESISELARRYNVPMTMIAAWNGLDNLNRIRAGQTLAFYLQDMPAVTGGAQNGRPTYYKVQGGDTLWTIAQKFQTTPDKIRRWNRLEGDLIHPGLRLLLKMETDLDA
jgi:membrane-bound lytic murein transglycosylase D